MVKGVVLTSLEVVESATTAYELPPEGITSLGYVVRRMHKTSILNDLFSMIEQSLFGQALSQIAYYAAASAVSFGALHYEPSPNEIGATIFERDPETGAGVQATLVNRTPNDHYTIEVRMPDGSRFSGQEQLTDSRFGVRGWVHPAAVSFAFVTADESYKAECCGTISREVVPRIAGPWYSRALGSIKLSDSEGNVGHLTLQRNARAVVTVSCCSGMTILHREVILS